MSLIFLTLGVRILTLGTYPLMDKTESRYAEIAREMLASGDWIVPHLDPDVPFWGKPPLSMWTTAVSLKIFGLNEFAARLPSVLWSILTLFLTYLLAKAFADEQAALLAVSILMSTGMFFVISGSVMTDPALTAMTTLVMISFALVMRDPQGKMSRWWAWLFFTGLGLGILAKGPVAWVLIGLPIIVWALIFGQVKATVRNFPWIIGMLWALLIAVPWHILAEKHSPGFLNYYILGEHWKRFTVSGWKGDLYGSAHVHPKGLIWPFMFVCTLPWGLVVLFLNRYTLIRESFFTIRRDRWLAYLWLWFLSPAFFFSFASNISIYYGLPGIPAFAILCAGGMRTFLSRQDRPPGVRWIVFMILFVPLTFFIATMTFLPGISRLKSQKDLAAAFDRSRGADARLVYVQPMPDSADFYSRGRAVNLGPLSNEEILAMLKDSREEFFVIRAKHTANIFQEINMMSYLVGQYGEYVLRRECGHDPQHVRMDSEHSCITKTLEIGE